MAQAKTLRITKFDRNNILKVNIKVANRLKIRVKAASWLMWLAAKVLGAEIKFIE